ncbi:ribonuclease domain-containing protein [Terrabacter sp. 2RAF25]|uniref:ribonuclease domain-containing protein n=1 Tax=Terrabacter sp. 2RAF25 TaxID=3232998 RepID=UPI003F980B46
MKSVAPRQALLGVMVVVVVVLAWLVVRAAQGPTDPQGRTGSAAATTLGGRVGGATAPATTQGTDPVSRLPWVSESALPREARDTLTLIRAGGPYPYPRSDNKTFDNRERLLPDKTRGYYREFTVVTPRSGDRGPRRLITGGSGEIYWTDDHYASFHRVREGT